jgi:hypothetical protein
MTSICQRRGGVCHCLTIIFFILLVVEACWKVLVICSTINTKLRRPTLSCRKTRERRLLSLGKYDSEKLTKPVCTILSSTMQFHKSTLHIHIQCTTMPNTTKHEFHSQVLQHKQPGKYSESHRFISQPQTPEERLVSSYLPATNSVLPASCAYIHIDRQSMPRSDLFPRVSTVDPVNPTS